MSTAENDTRVANPFANAPVVAVPSGASAAALVQREIAEIQAAMTVAKKFPRDPKLSVDRITNAFSRTTLAECTFYSYARGGSSISGLSIRAAEQLARDWGNIKCGVKELSRGNGQSEVLTYAWDLETGFSDEKIFFVKHWRDTKKGGYAVSDERDVYEVVANVAARRKRACILAVIPGDVQEIAERQATVTLKTKVKITPELIQSLIDKFTEFDVTKSMLERRIQRAIEAIEPGQVIQLGRIYNSLRDNMAVVADFFEPDTQALNATEGEEPEKKGTEGVKEKLKAKQANKASAAGQQQQKDAKDLGSHIPQFDEKSAIEKVRKQQTKEAVLAAYDVVVKDFELTGRDLPVSIEAAKNDRIAALEQI